MFRSAHKRPRLDAATLNNGLDWLTRQQSLFAADRTPFAVIHHASAFSVRCYAPNDGATTKLEPVVLVPPLAIRPSIFDLLPERSLVRYLTARGFDVYLVNWHKPQRADDDLGLADYALTMLGQALDSIRADSGLQALSLVGFCMGGLFSLLYAGSGRDTNIARLICVATPTDMHNGTLGAAVPRLLHRPAQILRRHTKCRLRNVNPTLFHIPGRVNALAFKLSSPMSGASAMRNLLTHLGDRDAVVAHSTIRDWLNHMHAYPGALIRDFTIQLWLDNALIQGPVQLGNPDTDLARIDCPVLAIAGDSDTVVGVASTSKLLDRVASRDKSHIVAPGGHFGVMAGSRAPDRCWPHMADWLTARN